MRSFVRLFVCLLVCLSVCLSICSPALAASTTGSMISYSTVRSVDSATVKAAGVFYNSKTGSYTVGNYNGNDLTDYTISQFDSYVVTASIDRNYDSGTPYYGIRYNITDLNIDAASILSLDINGLIFFSNLVSDDSSQSTVWPALLPSTTSPYKAYVTYTWSGSGYMPPKTEEGSGSWISISNQSGTSDVSVTYDNEWFLPADFGSSIMYRPSADYRYSMSFDIPDTYTKNGYTYDVMSASVDSCVVTVVYPYTVNTMYANFDKDLSLYGYDRVNIDGNYMRWYPIFNYSFGNSIAILSTSSGQSVTNQVGGMIGQVNQSIGKLNQTVTTEINGVKQEIVKGAETVKNEIQNQTQKVEQGFTSVTDKMDENITKVEEGFTAVTDGIKEQTTEVKESVDSLPEKFKELFLELFIPPEEELTAFYDEFSVLMSSKLGFIWQVIDDILLGLFRTLMDGFTDPQTTITIPAVSLPFPGANMSLWPEMTFPIIPPGLEFLATFTKRLSDVVMVLLVINRALDFRNTFFEYYTAAAPVGEQIANEYFAEQDRKAANRAYYQRRANFAKARGRR